MMSSTGAQLQLAARGSEGLYLKKDLVATGPNLFEQTRTEEQQACRVFVFSNDGNYFAYCDCQSTKVIEVDTGREVLSVDLGRTSQIAFSPKTSFLCTWEPYGVYGKQNADQPQQPSPNLRIFDLKSGKILGQLVQRKMQGWCPQWSEDETICARLVGSELLFHTDSYEKYSHKYVEQKLADFSLSRGPPPFHVACYTPGKKGQPALARVHRCDGTKFATAANKTFWKADRVSMQWNARGNALIVMAITDVDSTGKSYYGEQNLYLVLTNSESFMVPLGKNGPVYNIDWNPNSAEFCVVYGYMPAKVTLYNIKGEATFDFGIGPRNEVHYNAFGNILLICGFGNLAGNMEFWSPKDKKLVCKIQVPNTTQFEWAPDGQHFVTATTTPRLREDNGYRIWHYSGKLITEKQLPKGQELWEARWRPRPETKSFELKYLTSAEQAVAGLTSVAVDGSTPFDSLPSGSVSKGVYVPPHLRGKQGSAPKTRAQNGPAVATAASQLGDKEKKIRNLQKKIDQIKLLKDRQAAGEKLELNQIDKIEKENELISELERLKLS